VSVRRCWPPARQAANPQPPRRLVPGIEPTATIPQATSAPSRRTGPPIGTARLTRTGQAAGTSPARARTSSTSDGSRARSSPCWAKAGGDGGAARPWAASLSWSASARRSWAATASG
jgi:hypothetical protein